MGPLRDSIISSSMVDFVFLANLAIQFTTLKLINDLNNREPRRMPIQTISSFMLTPLIPPCHVSNIRFQKSFNISKLLLFFFTHV